MHRRAFLFGSAAAVLAGPEVAKAVTRGPIPTFETFDQLAATQAPAGAIAQVAPVTLRRISEHVLQIEIRGGGVGDGKIYRIESLPDVGGAYRYGDAVEVDVWANPTPGEIADDVIRAMREAVA